MGKTITRSKGNTTWSKASTTRSIHKPRVSSGYQGPGVEGRGDESRCCHGDQSRRMMCWPEVLASRWERGRLTVFARNTEQLLTQLKLWPLKKYWQMLRHHKCWKAQWLSWFTTIKWLHTVSWMSVLPWCSLCNQTSSHFGVKLLGKERPCCSTHLAYCQAVSLWFPPSRLSQVCFSWTENQHCPQPSKQTLLTM